MIRQLDKRRKNLYGHAALREADPNEHLDHMGYRLGKTVLKRCPYGAPTSSLNSLTTIPRGRDTGAGQRTRGRQAAKQNFEVVVGLCHLSPREIWNAKQRVYSFVRQSRESRLK